MHPAENSRRRKLSVKRRNEVDAQGTSTPDIQDSINKEKDKMSRGVRYTL